MSSDDEEMFKNSSKSSPFSLSEMAMSQMIILSALIFLMSSRSPMGWLNHIDALGYLFNAMAALQIPSVSPWTMIAVPISYQSSGIVFRFSHPMRSAGWMAARSRVTG